MIATLPAFRASPGRRGGDAVEHVARAGDGLDRRVGVRFGAKRPRAPMANGDRGFGREHAGHPLSELRGEVATEPRWFEVQVHLEEQPQLVGYERPGRRGPRQPDDVGWLRLRGICVHGLGQFHVPVDLLLPNNSLPRPCALRPACARPEHSSAASGQLGPPAPVCTYS